MFCYPKSLKIIPLAFLLLSLLATIGLNAKANFRDYQNKGNEQIKIMQRLFQKYQFSPQEQEAFQKLENDWRLSLTQYNLATGKERNYALKSVASHYEHMENIARSLCQSLENHSANLLQDFSQRVKNAKPETLPKEKYSHQLRVAQGEFYRGSEYCRKGQYAAGAHLYDRGIMVLKRRYQVFQWPLPENLFSPQREETLASKK